jgi:hypothetical protein
MDIQSKMVTFLVIRFVKEVYLCKIESARNSVDNGTALMGQTGEPMLKFDQTPRIDDDTAGRLPRTETRHACLHLIQLMLHRRGASQLLDVK